MERGRTVPRPHAGPERGVRVHPLARRRAGQELEQDGEVAPLLDDLLDPHHRHEGVRQRRAHAPVPLRLDDAHRARLRDGRVRPGDRDGRAEERLPQVGPRRRGQRRRVVGKVGLVERLPQELGDLAPAAVDGGDEEVRRPLSGELHDELGEVGLDRPDPGLEQRLVEADLVGRERLHLHDLPCARAPHDARHDLVRLDGVARPVHLTAGARDLRLEPDEELVEAQEGTLPDRLARPAKLLPVGRLRDDGRPPGANRRRCAQHVRASPRVRQGHARRALERHRRRRAARGRAHVASTSARWTARTGLRCRSSPPRMWRRQEASQAHDRGGARVADAPELVREHRARDVGVPDGERPAEAAALRRVRRAGAARPRARRAGATRGGRRRGAPAASGTWGGT